MTKSEKQKLFDEQLSRLLNVQSVYTSQANRTTISVEALDELTEPIKKYTQILRSLYSVEIPEDK